MERRCSVHMLMINITWEALSRTDPFFEFDDKEAEPPPKLKLKARTWKPFYVKDSNKSAQIKTRLDTPFPVNFSFSIIFLQAGSLGRPQILMNLKLKYSHKQRYLRNPFPNLYILDASLMKFCFCLIATVDVVYTWKYGGAHNRSICTVRGLIYLLRNIKVADRVQHPPTVYLRK